jgi:hypothetical protein
VSSDTVDCAVNGMVLAHGIGGREDLPIPFSYAVVGAALALAISFVALGLLWRKSRLRGDEAGRPLPDGLQAVVDAPAFRWTLRLIGLAVTAFVAYAAIFGPDLANNPTAGFVYVIFWVGLVPLSLLFGPVWRLLNPLRTVFLLLTGVLRTPAEEGLLRLPKKLGYWPAAVSLFSFVWLELAAPDRASTGVLRAYFAGYAGVHLFAASLFGSRWFDRGDGFEVYSALIGRLAPLGRRADGRLVLRNPLDGLDGLPVAPGLAATACVLLGSTAFDGLSNSPAWLAATQGSSRSPAITATLGLLVMILLVAGLYVLAARLSGMLGRTRHRMHAALSLEFAHSLVPIAVGYLVAHYFSLLLFGGQQTLIWASDPLVNGSNLFGTAEATVTYTLVSPTAIAAIQVLAVVTGHLLGVVAAHDRAVRLFPRRHAVAGQLPMMLLMIGYTVGGLTLLFAA